MALVAEFTMPADALPFGEALQENPDVRVEIDRIIPTSTAVFPYFWLHGTDPECFLERAEREPQIARTRILDRVDGRVLFSTEWSAHAEIIHGIKTLGATIVRSEGTARGWWFEVRAMQREMLTGFQELFEAAEVPVSLNSLYSLEEVMNQTERPLTEPQRETMLLAYQEGYFDEPRGITQSELGDRFDVSHRAISSRLRRATRNLVASNLAAGAENE